MPAAAFDALDGPVAALVHDLPDALAPVTLTSPSGRAVPLFSTPAKARAHLDAVPSVRDAPAITVLVVAPDDPRAKEELLRAAANIGAIQIVFDLGEDLEPVSTLAIDLALGHLEAAKRNAACL